MKFGPATQTLCLSKDGKRAYLRISYSRMEDKWANTIHDVSDSVYIHKFEDGTIGLFLTQGGPIEDLSRIADSEIEPPGPPLAMDVVEAHLNTER